MTFQKIKASLPNEPLQELGKLPFRRVGRGKVREIYDLHDRLLIVATDRLSAFDVVMPQGVPGKGILLTQLSLWWFERTSGIMANHLVDDHEAEVARILADFPDLQPRSMIVHKLQPLPLEAVVRGYLAGSGWKSYHKDGGIHDVELPQGLRESSPLPEPVFTPTTKATEGHDEPISEQESRELVGSETFAFIRDASLRLFAYGTRQAERAGLILADTKFEFGTDADGYLYLIDEVLTPDSSRYWPQDGYQPGKPQPAFDKQFVRDYLDALDWDKMPPGPQLPDEVIHQTRDIYLAALDKLMK